ncbi:hypothetical protein RRG08_044269 [Elysia crispata]|uniref:Uncharacterized protein n=1 Tax=Elysia crispata TaxID=231223 RepID=A0AAE1CNJ7_9GAST|nr:hypothetical protein RRG08_044269 [Elysia crispata]
MADLLTHLFYNHTSTHLTSTPPGDTQGRHHKSRKLKLIPPAPSEEFSFTAISSLRSGATSALNYFHLLRLRSLALRLSAHYGAVLHQR